MTPVQSPAVNSVASAVSPVTQQAIITSRLPQSPSLQTRSPLTAETGKPQVTGKCMIGIKKINICKNLYSELRLQHTQCAL